VARCARSANCQVAVTAALWTGVRAYLLGAALYLPEEWVTDSARQQARIPARIGFQEKWRQALTLLRQVRASGFTVTAVLADAEFGDNGVFRAFCTGCGSRTRWASRRT
jgi:SRSO17 transposase